MKSISRGPRFKSQHPHGCLHPSVTPVNLQLTVMLQLTVIPKNLIFSYILCSHQAHKWCIDICKGKIPIHVKIKI